MYIYTFTYIHTYINVYIFIHVTSKIHTFIAYAPAVLIVRRGVGARHGMERPSPRAPRRSTTGANGGGGHIMGAGSGVEREHRVDQRRDLHAE